VRPLGSTELRVIALSQQRRPIEQNRLGSGSLLSDSDECPVELFVRLAPAHDFLGVVQLAKPWRMERLADQVIWTLVLGLGFREDGAAG
jgi:hypothetical protein